MKNVSIRIAGANGDGVESSGALIMKVASKSGLHVFGYRGYQSIIRGGHVWYQVRLGDEKLYSHGKDIDILIALNQESIKYQKSHLGKNAIVIYDPSKVNTDEIEGKGFRLVKIPLLDIAIKVSGDPIMRNVAAIGATLKFVGIDLEVFKGVVKDMWLRKGEKVVKDNIDIATTAYNYEGVSTVFGINGDGKQRYTMDGNTAFSIGTFAGGCKFYSAYPMTPASGILHWYAAHQNKGVLFKQTEDELAAMNMAVGASVGGVRAMCGTSGGGFSLMVEGLGFAGMVEAPVVVVDSQRTGPSTGLPTKTEQADLLFVMHASQGEFPRIVVAPRSVEECLAIGAEVFNLAERYQCPVLVLLDLYLSERIESIDGFNVDPVTIDRGKLVTSNTTGERFKRYEITEDGISPRGIPGNPGTEFIAPSDEHNEYGDLISDSLSGIDEYVELRRQMHAKRMRKIETMLKNEKIFVPEISDPSAEYFLVTFGSTTEPVEEAAKILSERGMKVGVISFNYIMPMDSDKTRSMLQGKKLIDVECNYTAQLAQVIKTNTGIEIKNRILRYDGEAVTGDDLAESAEEVIKNFKG